MMAYGGGPLRQMPEAGAASDAGDALTTVDGAVRAFPVGARSLTLPDNRVATVYDDKLILAVPVGAVRDRSG